MNNIVKRTIAVSLVLILTLGMLSGCSNRDAVVTSEIAETAPKAADGFLSVTIDADGKQITMEDATNMSIQEILTRAKITLNEGDILSIDPAQMIGGNFTVKVLRLCYVTVTVAAEDPTKNVSYPVALAGATVADAIRVVGLKLADNQTTSYPLEDLLVDNMEIIISTVKEEPKPTETTAPTEPSETTEATEAAPTEEEDDWSDDDWYEDDWSDDDWSDDDWSDDDWSDDDWYEEPTTPPATEPPATEPPATEPPATEPPATEPSRYVVSEDIYYDCDGSGHGVKVITWSDGTQEEVYF